jgi:hypothetical protein
MDTLSLSLSLSLYWNHDHDHDHATTIWTLFSFCYWMQY